MQNFQREYRYQPNKCKNYKTAKNQNKYVIRIIIKLCYHIIYKIAKNQNKIVINKISNKNLIIINKLIRINYNKNN